MMTTTDGHIFNCDVPDVELADVIFNRRNLVVLLPSLENDPDTNAALGKTCITAQHYALAAALGASIEGDYVDLVENRPSSARTPYLMLYDESNYFATRGIDVMMAQGRELNVSIWMPAGNYVPFRALFRDMPAPYTGPTKGGNGLVNPKIDRRLFETMVAFEIRAGATEAHARKSVASALNQAAV